MIGKRFGIKVEDGVEKIVSNPVTGIYEWVKTALLQ